MPLPIQHVRKTVKTTNGVIVRYDLFGREFQRKLEKKNRRVLFRTGKYGLVVYKRTVGKRRPTEPPKFTKTGKISKRYIRWQERLQQPRPPYRVRGQLRGNSAYNIDSDNLSVVVGPYKIPNATTNAGKPIPRLLEEGGPATIRVGKKKPKRIRVKFRKYPFVGLTRSKTQTQFLKIMKQVPLT